MMRSSLNRIVVMALWLLPLAVLIGCTGTSPEPSKNSGYYDGPMEPKASAGGSGAKKEGGV